MAVTLHRSKGDQFFDSNGNPLSGGMLYYYQAGTTSQGYTYSELTGVTQNSFPLVLDSSGRLQTAVFLGSDYDYKELLTDSLGSTISPWPFDGIPRAASTANPLTGFERLYQPWVLVNAANTPLTAATSAVGTAYECDASAGTVTVNLPSVALCQTGTGFTVKKIDTTDNSVIIAPNGTDTIDGLNSSVYLRARGMCVGVTGDGAQWLSTLYAALPYFLAGQRQDVTANEATLTINMSIGWNVALTLSANVTTFNVSNWPADGTYGKLTLEVTNSGSYNITDWPGNTVWAGGSAPTITTGVGGTDTIVLTSSDGGTNFRGFIASQNMS